MTRGSSLGRRLFLISLAATLAATVFATVAIGFVLHRFIQGQIDQRLDTHISFLASTLRNASDGTLTLSGNADGPPFDRPDRGWYWTVIGAKNTIRSQSLSSDASLRKPPGPPAPHREPERAAEHPRPWDGAGPDGRALHARFLDIVTDAGPTTIIASAPRAAVLGPLREALIALAVSLILLAGALLLAATVQVRLGLRPLVQLRQNLDRVRAGLLDRLPADQPAEIQPLVESLNALLAQNDTTLQRTRRHVANLAHGLKTPLATLAIGLRNRSPEDLALVHTMDRRIRHHLGRARAAEIAGPVRARADVATTIEEIALVLNKVFSDRAVEFTTDVAPQLAVACEKQDLDEIVGNVLENAFQWARQRVDVTARSALRDTVTIVVEDDGPGLSDTDAAAALLPGQRLDERTPGFGFGLPIAQELSELYGGSLAIERSAWGGASIVLTLPGHTGNAKLNFADGVLTRAAAQNARALP